MELIVLGFLGLLSSVGSRKTKNFDRLTWEILPAKLVHIVEQIGLKGHLI
jgi:hypothetical protein